jgi:hypothetical protein
MKVIIKNNTKRLKKPVGEFKKQMESEEIHPIWRIWGECSRASCIGFNFIDLRF